MDFFGEDNEGMGSLFDLLRGGRSNMPSRRPKMKSMQYALEVTLDEIYKGEEKKIKLSRMRICKKCKGYLLISMLEKDTNQKLNQVYVIPAKVKDS